MMMDDSLKRKLYEESPVSKMHKSPMANAVRVQYQRARTELQQNPQLRNDLRVGSLGVLMGIILGGLLATTTSTNNNSSVASNNLPTPGWNPVHVFYGKMNHLYQDIPAKWYLKHDAPTHTSANSKEWFGQHGQDVAVAKFFNFKSGGFFVDLASNDAVWASNTFALEQNFGWHGICIEANPVYWYRLSFRTNCQVAGAIVGDTDFSEVKVNLPKDPKKGAPYGGIVGKDFDNHKVKDAVPRYGVSLLTILQKFDAPHEIDYLSLDVEGAEHFILKDFPFHKPYTFKVISIERPKDELKKKLVAAGYSHVMAFKRGDTLWAHSSVYEEGKKNVESRPEEIDKHMVESFPGRIS